MSQTKESSKTPTCDSGAFLEARDAPLITLVVGETQLVVHKSVLVARSPVFAAMLAHDTLEASSGRIVITDIEPEAVRQLVMFTYKDSAPQLCDMAPQLLVAADKYCVPELKAQCELQMVRDLTVENAVSSALLALRHSCPCLKETVGCFLHANLTKVMAMEGWAEAVRSNPEEFVELSRLLAATRNTIQEEMNKKLLNAINTSNNNNSSSKVKEVQELLDNGANVGARDVSGRTVLHYSTVTAITECLLAAGALVNARDKWHRTPIHSAIQRGNTCTLSRLVAASSNINAADVYGDTLLHVAAQLGDRDVVKTLLEAGADKDAKNNFGETPLDVAERCKKNNLVSTLGFLATGDSFKTISFSYRLGKSTVGAIVHDTSRAVIELLLDEAMPVPNEEKWYAIAEEFWTKWQFPNCIGALDGKHVTIQAPNNSGSLYWNYKKTYSIVLLALVDPSCNFIAIDVGAYGKNSDGGILVNSNLGKSLENNTLSIPKAKTLPGTDVDLPLVIVGDEAFPLKTYLMRPFPGKCLPHEEVVYNYHLSRSRRTAENAFGILQQKFRMFRRILQGDPKNLTMIVTAACVLYNFIRKMEGYTVPEQRTDQKETAGGSGRASNLRKLPRVRGRSSDAAFYVRDQLKKFFNSPQGSVDWIEHVA